MPTMEEIHAMPDRDAIRNAASSLDRTTVRLSCLALGLLLAVITAALLAEGEEGQAPGCGGLPGIGFHASSGGSQDDGLP
jgi:hypothetical protein